MAYRNETGGTEQLKDVALPWEYDLGSPNSGQFFYISAQNRGSSGTVVAEILVKGVPVKHSESSGAYVIATVSGKY